MHLLHSSPVASPQFVSLSLLVKEGMAEPMLTVSPTATIDRGNAIAAVRELHDYVKTVLNRDNVDDFSAELLKEDEKSLKTMQIYRPLSANGVGLHYKLLRGAAAETPKLQALVLASNCATPGKIDPSSGVIGAILTVAVAGLGSSCLGGASTTIPYTMNQRVSDCIGYLQRTSDVTTAKSVLTTFLLTDDELRQTNEMTEAPNLLLLPELGAQKGLMLTPMGMISPIAEFGRKTARRASTGMGGMGLRGSNAQQPDTEEDVAPDVTFPISLELGSADASRNLVERLAVLSVAETDTILSKYEHTGQERKANLDLTGGAKGSRFRRRKAETRDADFDNFDYRGPVKETIERSQRKTIPALQPTSSEPLSTAKLQLRSSRKDTKKGGPGTRRLSAHMGGKEDDSASQPGNSVSFDLFAQKNKTPKPQFDDETQDSRSHSGKDASSVHSQQRVQVNLALNEDLTCSYKLSQLSSCNVEGVVQVQMKPTVRGTTVPFSLLVRDPSSHIDSLSENKKFAENASARRRKGGDSADYRFNISIPNQDAYFPLLKYKCSGDLRPVPIRVQTKVKADGGFCRVALQISSNPNNDASLSDLTIVMGVPAGVKGDSLASQPAGGVWDEAKSSVIWCVSELGGGEKFQLQARFALEDESVLANELNFPVLVRCQCLHVQLSDIEFEVIDNPEVSQAEMIMKLARRYRLSHREKNG